MKGAIFDMDGLLLDSERLYQRCWHQLARERGVTLPPDFAVRITGSGQGVTQQILGSCFPGEDPKALNLACRAMVMELEKTDLQLKPGAAELLPALQRAGYRLAVASSSPRDMVRTNLERTGILGFFDTLVCGDEVRRGKPEPDIFLLAAGRLALPPAECYVLEDSANGLLAARAAGCRAVMIPDLVPPAPELTAFAAVYPDLTAFGKAVIAQLSGLQGI